MKKELVKLAHLFFSAWYQYLLLQDMQQPTTGEGDVDA